MLSFSNWVLALRILVLIANFMNPGTFDYLLAVFSILS